MRFKAGIRNANTFTKFVGSLAFMGNVAWVRLSNDEIGFTIIPEKGTQVWAVLSIETVFESYTIQSAAENNAINLEVPLQPLVRALRSAYQATSASIRLTKKDNMPTLCMTIAASIQVHARNADSITASTNSARAGNYNTYGGAADDDTDPSHNLSEPHGAFGGGPSMGDQWRDTIITQDIPIRVLSADSVAGLHEPVCREPDVHIVLPPLAQLKAISDRFTKLALATSTASTNNNSYSSNNAFRSSSAASKAPKLELSATMHGSLRLALRTDALNIASTWTGLQNPELDPRTLAGGAEEVAAHPSTRMRQMVVDGDVDGGGWGEGWAGVRIDGRDWGRVLSVGRLGGRVIASYGRPPPIVLDDE